MNQSGSQRQDTSSQQPPYPFDTVRSSGIGSVCVRADPGNAIRLLKILDGFDITDVAPALKTPTLVLHGSMDHIQPPSDGRALASLIPGSDLVVMEGKGHVPMMSSPAEVVSIIEKWIKARNL